MTKLDAATFARYAADPSAFRDDLLIDCDGEPKRLGDAMQDWQRTDFAALDPALRRCNGRAGRGGTATMRAYLERPRGHSKTTDIAVVCCWALAFAKRPIRGYAFAADRDQSALLKDAVATLLRLNPWLGSILAVEAGRVVNVAVKHPGKGGTLTIETSDVGSSYGILPDLIVADELCHWQGDGSLWHSLISSAAKRAGCLVLCISNAGFRESWQWGVREAARTDPGWFFSRLDGPMAGWLTADRLAVHRRMLPAIAFCRLWLIVWSASGGDALTPEDVNAAFLPHLEPMTGHMRMSFGSTIPLWRFVAGVDLGLTRDASAVVVLAVPFDGRGQLRLAHHRVWRPPAGGKVDLSEVERHLLRLDEEYHLECISFDPWQGELLAQRIEVVAQNRPHRKRSAYTVSKHRLPFMRELAPTGSMLREQASLVIESFQDRRVACYVCEPLRADLLKLRVEEKSYGLRLVSPRDASGHGDTFSAFANALTIAHEFSAKPAAVAGPFPSTAGGATGSAAALAQMNASVMGRAQDKLEREATICAERIQKMRDYPDFKDSPLYREMKRLRSPRVM
jgi:hypothetical protein